jgi:hypothetical protein
MTSSSCPSWLRRPVKAVLLDISGVLRDGDIAIKGSIEAFHKYARTPINMYRESILIELLNAQT